MDSKIPFSKIFYKFWSHIAGSVSFSYGLNYLLAGVLTLGIVQSGFDWIWNRFSVAHPIIFYAGFASALLGMFIPVVVPLGLYISGRIKKKLNRQITALALGQAAILGFVISTVIKLFTGRIPPESFGKVVNNSHGFQFGFYRGGWFDGWPSSHTAVAFAAAAALIALYPNNKAVKIGALVFAFAIGLGVSLNIHWFSDFVAGALIGYAIGKTVGWDFKKLMV
jgi:membrane-associated phospholipid phosphatase